MEASVLCSHPWPCPLLSHLASGMSLFSGDFSRHTPIRLAQVSPGPEARDFILCHLPGAHSVTWVQVTHPFTPQLLHMKRTNSKPPADVSCLERETNETRKVTCFGDFLNSTKRRELFLVTIVIPNPASSSQSQLPERCKWRTWSW